MTYTLPFLHKYRFIIAILLTAFVSTSIVAFKMASPALAASDSARVSAYIVPSHETTPAVDGSITESASSAEAITATGKLTFPRSAVTTTPAPKKEEPAAKKNEDAKPATPSPANAADATSTPAAAVAADESASTPAVAQAQAQTKAPSTPAAPANNNSAPAPVAAAPMEGTSPAAAQSFARSYLAGQGMGEAEFQCLVTLWNRESGWNFQANNPSSGAYGIPQSLPGSKMASVGADWQTNPKTQIIWGVGYITGRYGTPCGAVASWNIKGWY